MLAIRSCCTTDGIAGTGSHSSESRSLNDQPVDRFIAIVDYTERIAFPGFMLLYFVDGLRFPTFLPFWTRKVRGKRGLVVINVQRYSANTQP